jgi:hypothetical protein
MDPSSISHPDPGSRPRAKGSATLDHATELILRVCQIAGSASFVDDAREALAAEGVHAAVRTRNTAALFDWLVSILSYQGISDQVAFDYMERHGQATWHVIASDLRRRPSCPKLESYWHFHDCRYNKTRYTCAEPDHLPGCPLPNHWLRNGRLNQTAYGLHLFIRDVAVCQADHGWTYPFIGVKRPGHGAPETPRLTRRKVRAHAQQERSWPFCPTISYRSYFLK